MSDELAARRLAHLGQKTDRVLEACWELAHAVRRCDEGGARRALKEIWAYDDPRDDVAFAFAAIVAELLDRLQLGDAS